MTIAHVLRDRCLVAVLTLVACVIGCSPGQQASSHTTVAAAEKRAATATVPDTDGTAATGPAAAVGRGPVAEEISLRVADTGVFQQVLDENQGKVVLVDFWATWCLPCRKNFPKMLQYKEKYKQAGLAIVSVSVDDPSARDEALQFLRSIEADSINLISKWGAGTESAERFNFSGEVPYYRLYDRQGMLRYEFSSNGGTSTVPSLLQPLEQIEPRLRELLELTAS